MPVFRRNFTAYFLNPTGYVFICVFVLLGSIAAFMPDEFVNSNLANLAQLNRWFPLILLVFIPAITMGIWADEKRYATDELLLTLPVSPSRLVIGKYLASVAIYSVSLVLSLFSNYMILEFLGDPDPGLFLSTYLGYWLMGIALLGTAMVASFLTHQLTVAYILGALLCAPLVAIQWGDVLPVSGAVADLLKSFSIEASFEPFGRGMISLAAILYFILIPCAALYLCVALLAGRYVRPERIIAVRIHQCIRFAALILAIVAFVGLGRIWNVSFDATAEKLSTLSPESISLLRQSKAKYPIVIEAWLSPGVPPEFIQTRQDIVSILKEITRHAPGSVFLDIRPVLPNTKEAWQLERQYDIKPRKVVFDTRGRIREEEIIMAIIFRCGPRTTVIGFLNRGLAVEYELVSAFVNVGERELKTIGILRTDAALLGGVDATGRQVRRPWSIVDELARQYNIVDVDPSEPIPLDKIDALLAVQPSSLGPGELAHFAAAIRSGIPTVLFEDPYPIFADFVPGTRQKRKSRDPAVMLKPKGEFGVVLALLGLEFDTDVLWKTYNPYPKLAGLSEEFVFIDAKAIDYTKDSLSESEQNESAREASGAILNQVLKQDKPSAHPGTSAARQLPKVLTPFNQDDSTVKHLEHLLMPFCGSLKQDPRAETTMISLIQTDAQGTTSSQEIASAGIRSHGRTRTDKPGVYTVAARIEGKIPSAFRQPGLKETSLNVAFVTDLDLLTPGFFRLRELGTDVRSGVAFDFDNVTFVLNLIDRAAGQESLIPVRSRRPRHRTLTRIENTTRQIHDRAAVDQIAYMKEFEAFRKKEEESLQKRVQELANKTKSGQPGKEESLELQSAIVASQQRLTQILEEKQNQYNRKVTASQREVDEFVRAVQGRYKMFAILLPPVVPLSIGIVVYIARKRRQRRFRR